MLDLILSVFSDWLPCVNLRRSPRAVAFLPAPVCFSPQLHRMWCVSDAPVVCMAGLFTFTVTSGRNWGYLIFRCVCVRKTFQTVQTKLKLQWQMLFRFVCIVENRQITYVLHLFCLSVLLSVWCVSKTVLIKCCLFLTSILKWYSFKYVKLTYGIWIFWSAKWAASQHLKGF